MTSSNRRFQIERPGEQPPPSLPPYASLLRGREIVTRNLVYKASLVYSPRHVDGSRFLRYARELPGLLEAQGGSRSAMRSAGRGKEPHDPWSAIGPLVRRTLCLREARSRSGAI